MTGDQYLIYLLKTAFTGTYSTSWQVGVWFCVSSFIYEVGGCDLENQLVPALCSRNPLLYPTQQKKHKENIQLCSSRLFLATVAL